jgi:virginiamycin B lyase
VADGAGSIVTGPDGALWFTDYSSIGRMTTGGVVTGYYPTSNDAGDMILGPDAALWFIENSIVGRITTAGVVTEYPVPNAPLLSGIASGPDGALWLTDIGNNAIWRVNTSGVVTNEYLVPYQYLVEGSITAGSDGALWFSEDVDALGRITTSGIVTQIPLPGLYPEGAPEGITSGPDGALWFTAQLPAPQGGAVGRCTTDGASTFYPIATLPDYPYVYGGIVTGPDGSLWFTDSNNKVGDAVFVTAGLTVTPASGYYRSELGFTGSGFAPNEAVQI